MATFCIAFYESYLSAYGAIKTNRGELYIGLLAPPGPLYSSHTTPTQRIHFTGKQLCMDPIRTRILELKVQYVVPLPKKGIKIRSSSSCLVKSYVPYPYPLAFQGKMVPRLTKLQFNSFQKVVFFIFEQAFENLFYSYSFQHNHRRFLSEIFVTKATQKLRDTE
jgi:hypothetical protein